MITDRAAKSLEAWKHIEGIDLGNTKVGDDVCRVLAQCPTLSTLQLGYTSITDQGCLWN
ncbi:MAG: hypothetical protein R3C05_11395 [Pirellulaceae bacterium]